MPRGFTLLEVVVALAIGSMAILVAAAMLHTTARMTELLDARVRAVDMEGAGTLRLRRLIGQMTWSQPSEPAPQLSPDSMRFTTRCDVPAGWEERCTVDLLLSGATVGGGMTAHLSTGEDLRILQQESLVGFLYLLPTEEGGRWIERWSDREALPAAVGLVTRTDTLIVRIGDRG